MRIQLFVFFILVHWGSVHAQGFDLMMQAWYWDYFNQGNVGLGNWANHLTAQAPDLAAAGFKHIWTPPLPRSSTSNNVSNGYNPKDLYDFGEAYGGGACAWGTRANYNAMVSAFNTHGLEIVSDVVYNHRDGGRPERNDAVKTYIPHPTRFTPYPSDRFLCIIPLGSANPGNNGAGDYYIKVRSKAGQASNCTGNKNPYGNNQYKFYARTNATASYLGAINETEPNGGGACNQPSQAYTLGQDIICTLFEFNCCYTDEFKITLTGSNFNPADDTLFIYLTNFNSGYSDHYIHEVWSSPRNANIVNEVEYWTYTDFTNLPSGQGAMNFNNFRPNEGTATSENLDGDWNWMWFFYDYDQSVPSSQTVLNEWTKWQLSPNGASGAGIKGLRMDAVKHFDPAFVSQLMNYLNNQGTIPNMVVGEFFDSNPGLLKGWVDAVQGGMSAAALQNIKMRVFDFSLRDALEKSCDQFGYDVRNVFNSGIVDAAGASGLQSVTFVNNHDFRTIGEYCTNDPQLGYAYIMTNNQVGAPCIFYPDYYGVSPIVGVNPASLKARIDELSNVHQQYIFGSPDVEYLSRFSTPYYQFFQNGQASTTLIYQLHPPAGSTQNVIVAINFSGTALDVYQAVRTDWGIAQGSHFVDVLGYSGTTNHYITNNAAHPELRVQLPPRSYTVYVQQSAPLPVELVKFTAELLDKNSVQLRWETAREEAFDRYELERSVGNLNEFKKISEIPGRFSTAPGQYAYLDRDVPGGATLYYRLKMIDLDGTFSYSPVQSVTVAAQGLRGTLAPNPASHTSRLDLQTDREMTVAITVLNTDGMPVWSRDLELTEGNARIDLPVKEWQAGVYQVVVKGGGEVYSFRLVKI